MLVDETKLKLEIGYFLAAVKVLVSLVPGTFGNTLVAFLEKVASDKYLVPTVALVNAIETDLK